MTEMLKDTERRIRMIEAFQEMTSHTERRPGRSYGNCRICGAMIEWVVTASGKRMPQIPNTGEPHFPHCGKNKWTTEDWDKVMGEILRKEAEVNKDYPITVSYGGGANESYFKVYRGVEKKRKIKEFQESNTQPSNEVPW